MRPSACTRRRGHWLAPVVLIVALVTTPAIAQRARAPVETPPSRVVSLVPALTDMVLALGGRSQLVGVSSYDDEAEVKDLPRVGALLDPDVERVIALKPDLALAYGSQADLIAQLTRASIPTFSYRHGGLAHVFVTIRELGRRLGRPRDAEQLAAALESRIAGIRAKVAGAKRPRALLVFGRERGTLRGIYVSGGRGFLHDMLEAAGGTNVYADIAAESVQASSEMILTRAPEVIIEIRSTGSAGSNDAREMEAWTALASVPAVRDGRLHLLAGKSINVPGPLVAEGVERFARVLHPALMR